MLTRPLENDSRFMLLLMAADGVEATGRMLWRWFERHSRRGRIADSLRRLQASGLVAAGEGPLDERVYALTESGRQRLWGKLDPEKRWSRPWDGVWRMVIFDVPESRNALRSRLRRNLRELRFGWLQNSVWLSPDPVHELTAELRAHKVTVESLLFFEGRPAGSETDAELVSGAWDMALLAKRHADYLRLLRQRPPAGKAWKMADWSAWIDAEFRGWQAVTRLDPFLPEPLLPEGYAGKAVLQARQEALREAARAVAEACARL
jgi:phenylacetic acid degradation operon negative regulatory protein